MLLMAKMDKIYPYNHLQVHILRTPAEKYKINREE